MTSPGHPPPQAPVQPRNGLGTSALVLGIIGLLLAWIPIIGFIGFILGIVAIALGVVGILRARSGSANNLAVASVGTGLGVVAVILSTAVFAAVVNEPVKPHDATGSTGAPGASASDPTGQHVTNVQFGQTYTWSGGEAITVSAPRTYVPDNEFAQAPSGQRLVAVDVTVHNGTSRAYQVMMVEMTAQHAGRVAQEDYLGGDALPNTEVPPGGQVTFTKVWKVDQQPAELQISVKPGAFAQQTAFFTGRF